MHLGASSTSSPHATDPLDDRSLERLSVAAYFDGIPGPYLVGTLDVGHVASPLWCWPQLRRTDCSTSELGEPERGGKTLANSVLFLR